MQEENWALEAGQARWDRARRLLLGGVGEAPRRRASKFCREYGESGQGRERFLNVPGRPIE